jgi:hypothetical protein
MEQTDKIYYINSFFIIFVKKKKYYFFIFIINGEGKIIINISDIPYQKKISVILISLQKTIIVKLLPIRSHVIYPKRI